MNDPSPSPFDGPDATAKWFWDTRAGGYFSVTHDLQSPETVLAEEGTRQNVPNPKPINPEP